MEVFFDAMWWQDGPPSGKNVLQSLVRGWSADFPEDAITLLLPPRVTLEAADAGVFRVRHARTQQHAGAVMTTLNSGSADVVITNNFTPMMRQVLRCTYIYDIIYREHPEWFTRAERAYFWPITRLAHCADIVFTSAESEKKRIARFDRTLGERVVATRLGVPVAFSRVLARAPSLGLAGRPFLLSVGRLNVRKNVEQMLRSLRDARIVRPDQPMVVVGTESGAVEGYPTLQAGLREGSVIAAGGVPDAELKWLYENCEVFVFPSLDEGFGLPVLEAASSGARLALSRIAPFQEFGAEAGWFDPRNANSIAEGVARALSLPRSPASHSRVLERNSWSSTVSCMRRSIVSALTGGGT